MSGSVWPCELQLARLLSPLDSPGKNTGVGCHALLQWIFLTLGSNTRLLHLPALAGGFFTTNTTWEVHSKFLAPQIISNIKRLFASLGTVTYSAIVTRAVSQSNSLIMVNYMVYFLGHFLNITISNIIISLPCKVCCMWIWNINIVRSPIFLKYTYRLDTTIPEQMNKPGSLNHSWHYKLWSWVWQWEF